MATTIKSTDLDFNNIKNNLKEFLAQTPEFADYNFEASGLSSILDVLAYNTHYNSLLANFALNESFLSTAQLRPSLVSLANALGYSIGSKSASCAIINLYVINPEPPTTMTLPEGFSFTSTVDGKSYTFKTRQTLIATNNGSNQYYFRVEENQNVAIYEGTEKRKMFIAGPATENTTYVIPTNNIDLNTVKVRVYADTATSVYDSYTKINDVVSINKESKIYVVKETPNGQYELTFGNGSRLGVFPNAGNKIEVTYDSVAGPESNGARTFVPVNSVFDSQGNVLELNVVTLMGSEAGKDKEVLESIRKNAPYMYATQNRMVTALDYSSLVLNKFSNVISDIKSWGGEDNLPPEYGTVFLSIVFSTEDENIIAATKESIISVAKNLSVASFDIKFTDPIITYLEVDTFFQWNPSLTSRSQTDIESSVTNTANNYFALELGGFNKSFRRSNLLTKIDDTDPSILSSRAIVKMQSRFIPDSNLVNYQISFPASIAAPNTSSSTITSSSFNILGRVGYMRNRLNSTVMEIIDVSTGNTMLDNVGEYDPTLGILTLNSFKGTVASGSSYIKIVALPANESNINTNLNNLLSYDNTASTSSAVITNTV